MNTSRNYNTYACVKGLFDNGFRDSLISNILNIDRKTVTRIRRHPNYKIQEVNKRSQIFIDFMFSNGKCFFCKKKPAQFFCSDKCRYLFNLKGRLISNSLFCRRNRKMVIDSFNPVDYQRIKVLLKLIELRRIMAEKKYYYSPNYYYKLKRGKNGNGLKSIT